jgi:two-component system CheB/CheR fusion protein
VASQKLAYSSVVPVPEALLESESLFSADSAVSQQETAEPNRQIHLAEVPRGCTARPHGFDDDGLESIHREIQLSNQQLQATNQQLEVNRDALDSVRELLHRFNGEIASRNDLLMQVTSDLTNLLNNVDVPIVMVGPDLRVRRFTSKAATVLGLTPADTGRSIPHLRLRIDLRGLEAAMLDVIRDGQPCHRRMQDKSGSGFSLCMSPYRTVDGRVDGLVLTLADRKGSPAASRKPISPRLAQKKASRATVQPRNS